MYEGIVQLSDIFDTGAFVDGTVPKIVVLNEATGDTFEAFGITSAHNLETYWFTCYEDEEEQLDLNYEDIVERIDDFKEVDYYCIKISYAPDEGLFDGSDVINCGYDGETLTLFV